MRNNIFTEIPKQLSQELFDTLLATPQLRVERVVSAGHTTPLDEWYDQDWDEWVILLQGNARLRFANEAIVELHAGDYYLIPAHKRHQVAYTDPGQQCIWLALHFLPANSAT